MRKQRGCKNLHESYNNRMQNNINNDSRPERVSNLSSILVQFKLYFPMHTNNKNTHVMCSWYKEES